MRVVQCAQRTPSEPGAPKSNKMCDAFARLLAKFARFRIHDSKIFGAKCITDSAQSFCDVMIVAQPTQRTPAEFYVRGTQNLHKI